MAALIFYYTIGFQELQHTKKASSVIGGKTLETDIIPLCIQQSVGLLQCLIMLIQVGGKKLFLSETVAIIYGHRVDIITFFNHQWHVDFLEGKVKA